MGVGGSGPRDDGVRLPDYSLVPTIGGILRGLPGRSGGPTSAAVAHQQEIGAGDGCNPVSSWPRRHADGMVAVQLGSACSFIDSDQPR
jgi:hypothetical protein